MDIEYALLADHTEIAGGKLYLMGGGWDVTNVNATPVAIRVGVALGIRFGWGEAGKPVPVTVLIEDDDGHEFVHLDATLTVTAAPALPPGAEQLSQLSANFAFTAPEAGGYRVRITARMDEQEVERRLPFRVVKAAGA
jgi:hypothetical protein